MSLSMNNNNNISFKGIKGAYRADNVPVFEFVAPPHDEEKETVKLGIAPLRRDPKTGLYIEPKESDIKFCDFKDGKTLDVIQDKLRRLSQGFAYTYIIVPKDEETGNNWSRKYLDAFKTINLANSSEKMNIIEQGDKYGISPKGGSMYHAFIDSNTILDEKGNLLGRVPEKARNHFNKLGGSTKGLIYLLKHTDTFDPYTYLMVNPDIGADRVSSQAYWPECQYRSKSIDDFKEINRELYKQGKVYVADGAFTSQSLNSPIVQHALKWGKESPFYYMLATDGSGEIDPGVIPNVSPKGRNEAFEHAAIRLVNPKGEGYDRNKPTYIQFFDDRLLSKEKQNSKKLEFTYDKEPKDHYEITKDDDAVRPFSFEIDPYDKKLDLVFKKGELTKHLKDITNEKCGINLDKFLTFDNYKIVEKGLAKGATCWEGNVDLFKMNTSYQGSHPDYLKGCEDARSYLLGVASFWSETIQSDLILTTALMNNDEKRNVAFNNQISPKKYNDILEAIKNGKEISPVLSENKKPQDYIKEFPLQSIETDFDLGAVFSQPQFKDEFLTPATLKKLTDIVDNTIEGAIPEEYKGNEAYKTFVVKTFAAEIIQNAIIAAMDKNAINTEDGSIKSEVLKDINLKSLIQIEPSSPAEERRLAIKKITQNLNQDNVLPLRKTIAQKLQYISLNDFKLAEAIVLQGKAGLSWRFDAAKDIGDYSGVKDGSTTFDRVWNGDAAHPGVKNFWYDFIKNIRKYNPAPLIINEITMLDSFCPWDDIDGMMDFDPKSTKAWQKLSPQEQQDYKNHPPYVLEQEYLAESNSTTGSIFDNYFNNLSAMAGSHPEKGLNTAEQAGNLVTIKKQVDEMLVHTYPNSAMYAHFFTENHDKPRLLHTLPLDMQLYMCNNLEEANDIHKALARELTGGRTDYDHISAKAVAVGAIIKKEIEKQSFAPETKQALIKSLQNLVNGKRNDNDRNSYKRADAFGVLPYEVSLLDIFEDAGLKNFSQEDIQKIHHGMLNDSIKIQEALTQGASCLVGTPTIFNGAEFSQTGYETKNKNVYVANRNRILRELADNDLYKGTYRKNFATQGLSLKKDLSALRNGTPISLSVVKGKLHPDNDSGAEKTAAHFTPPHQGAFNEAIDKISGVIYASQNKGQILEPHSIFNLLDSKTDNPEEFSEILEKMFNISNWVDDSGKSNHDKFKENYESIKHYFLESDKDEINFYPIYKYDEKGSKVLAILTDNGLPTSKNITSGNNNCQIRVNKPKRNYKVTEIEITGLGGFCPLTNGTELKRKIYDETKGDYIDDNNTYIVTHDGKIINKDGEYIDINDSALYFYVPVKNQSAKYGTGYHGAH